MDLETYKSKMLVLEREHGIRKTSLMFDFAHSNSNVKVGDFFTDHIGTIKVEFIKLDANKEKPAFIFFGAEYTKKLKPFKSGSKRPAYQVNKV